MDHGGELVNLLVVTGEQSGDFQASLLLEEIKKVEPSAEFWGIGGDKLRACGMDVVVDIADMAAMGISDVAKKFFFYKKILSEIVSEFKRRRSDGAILVDFPGFNLRLASKLHKLGAKIVYYISPQVWAWGEGRVKRIKRYVDRMICILPFEPEFYAAHGVEVSYVGHPLYDVVKPECDEGEFREAIGHRGRFLVMMPGSREAEVRRLLEVMIDVVSVLRLKHKELIGVIPVARNVKKLFEKISLPDFVVTVDGLTYSAMAYADAGLIASGTAVLEAMLLGLPAVVVYRVDPLSWYLGRLLIKTRYFAIANIIAGEEVLPEFIQRIPKWKVIKAVDELLSDREKNMRLREKLLSLRDLLGPKGAAGRAAKIVAELFQ